MELSAKFKSFKGRIAARFQFFLRVARWEIDLVVVYSVTAAIVFILLRLQMLRNIVGAEDLGWQHLHGQLENPDLSHYYLRASWVIIDYLWASWVILRADMFYLTVLTILCLLFCAFMSSTRFRTGIIIVYFAVVFISLLLLSVNVELAPLYSTQLDYSLLKFSGLLTGATATLIAVTPNSFILMGVFVSAVLLAAPCLTLLKIYQNNRRRIRRSFCTIVACGLIAIVAVPAAVPIPGLEKLDKRESNNSLVFFLTSLVTARSPSFDLSIGEPDTSASSNPISLSNAQRPILAASMKDVLVIVLESVGAEYFELLREYGLLPTFSDIMSHSVYFKNSYVSAPVTAVSLVTMLTSTSPLGSFKIVTSDYPRASFTTSYEGFKSKGFVTGFFWSDDSEYLGMDNFLRDRGIDLVQDYRDRACPESPNLVHSDASPSYIFSADICTATSMLNWIDDNRGKPFFATLWTEQTHYPYAASSSCMNAVAAKGDLLRPEGMHLDSDWPRYAAALCDTDRMMANIISGLRERMLLENTLLIIVGDHGESFGQHNSFVHGSEIFEEDVRVPLLISAGFSLSGSVDGRLASHLDIAPTIASAFGIPPSDQWEGNDLLDKRAPRRVYFYTGWGNYKIGYHEANNKYIYDIVHQNLSSYNIATDPHENENLAGKDHGADARAISLVRRWYLQRAKFANTLH